MNISQGFIFYESPFRSFSNLKKYSWRNALFFQIKKKRSHISTKILKINAIFLQILNTLLLGITAKLLRYKSRNCRDIWRYFCIKNEIFAINANWKTFAVLHKTFANKRVIFANKRKTFAMLHETFAKYCVIFAKNTSYITKVMR